MKTNSASRFILTAAFATLIAVPSFAGSNLRHPIKPSGQEEPVIAAIKGRKVRVKVPEGFGSVTLQRKTAQKKKPWITLSTETLDGAAKEVVFTLRTPMTKPMLRVFGQQKGKLPSAFYTGTTNFLGETVVGQAGGNLTLGGTDTVTTNGAVSSLAAGVPRADSAVSSSRTVTESDIWKVDGDRLYFFNAYRGLQNIDISDVAAPALLGTLRMPAAGEDMYQLDSKHVAILKRTPKELGWTSGSPTFDAASQSGEIVVCDVSTPEPTIVARVPYEGSIANSRLIGNALVIARNVPRTEANNWSWRTDLEVTGYDLSSPTAPVVKNTVKFASTDGYWVSAVQASNQCFMVARPVYHYGNSRSFYSTDVHLVDVSNPNGTLVKGGSVTVEGYVDSKFKLHESGGVMSVVSAFSGWDVDSATGAGRWTQFANLQNFDISNIAAPTRLGGIEVGHNESTRAVRFDGDRVYIVTVVQQDPLWIIDNANPASPTLSGELHVPGFSSYIEPLGDRLVTVGRIWGDDGSGNWQNRTAVSLYDVADPTKPKQLSQLPVGTGWSHSEAEWDEKAFTVLPQSGLIMLPFNKGGWYRGERSSNGVQLIDLKRDSLALRGVVEHGFTPRRTALKDDAVIAVSAASLLAVDIADRDHPAVKADVELAWNVDRVWIAGKHLLQLGRHLSDRKPVLSVAPIENADDTLSTLELGDERVQAAEVKGDLLYVVQTVAGKKENTQDMKLSVFNIASLPSIVKQGEATTTAAASSGEYDILFPTDATAVVAQRNRRNSGNFGNVFILNTALELPSVPAETTGTIARTANVSLATSALVRPSLSSIIAGDGGCCFPWGWGTSTLSLAAFDIANPRAPKYLTTNSLEGLNGHVTRTSGYGNYSEAFAENGKVFASYYTGSRYGTVILSGADGTEIQHDFANRYFLNVVDYADPAAPAVAAPVSLPGELRAVTTGGDLLYVVGPGYDAAGKADSSQQFIHATAFDGTAHLVDSIPFGHRWSGDTFHVGSGNVFLNRNSYDSTTGANTSQFEAWTLGDDGKFARRDTLDIANANGWTLSGDLAIIPGGNASLRVINLANPSDLQLVGTYGNPSTWWWYSSYGSGSKVVGDLSLGFWIPEGDYGVKYIPAPK